MVFVHARKETVKTALALKEAAFMEGALEDFSCEEHPQFMFFRRDIAMSRNKEMKQLFDNGFGIHHAGMLRSDRNMMERMFEARAIKVWSLHLLCFVQFYLIRSNRCFAVLQPSRGVSTCLHMLVSTFRTHSRIYSIKILCLSRHQGNPSIRQFEGCLHRLVRAGCSPGFRSSRSSRSRNKWRGIHLYDRRQADALS